MCAPLPDETYCINLQARVSVPAASLWPASREDVNANSGFHNERTEVDLLIATWCGELIDGYLSCVRMTISAGGEDSNSLSATRGCLPGRVATVRIGHPRSLGTRRWFSTWQLTGSCTGTNTDGGCT